MRIYNTSSTQEFCNVVFSEKIITSIHDTVKLFIIPRKMHDESESDRFRSPCAILYSLCLHPQRISSMQNVGRGQNKREISLPTKLFLSLVLRRVLSKLSVLRSKKLRETFSVSGVFSC